MSVKNFIPELWESKILKELDKEHVLVKNCTTKWSGKIEGVGSRVKINSINSPTITTYTPNTDLGDAEQLKDESRWLEITESPSFHFFLDQVDEKQATGGLMQEGIRKAVIGLKDYVEAFLASKYTDAGSSVTNAALTSGNFFSTFMKAKRKLMRVGNVSTSTKCHAEVTPEVWEKGVLADILYNNQDNGEMIRKGQYVQSLGMTFYISNNIPVVETNEDVVAQTCIVKTKEALAYAEQIMSVKKYEPDKRFGEAAKGLLVCGAKMTQPKQACKMALTTAAETTI